MTLPAGCRRTKCLFLIFDLAGQAQRRRIIRCEPFYFDLNSTSQAAPISPQTNPLQRFLNLLPPENNGLVMAEFNLADFVFGWRVAFFPTFCQACIGCTEQCLQFLFFGSQAGFCFGSHNQLCFGGVRSELLGKSNHFISPGLCFSESARFSGGGNGLPS